MVLTAIFLQVYGDNHVSKDGVLITETGPGGLFFAIIAVAFVFLWLELMQFTKDKQGYFR
jgi:hypothetical protein